jgi:hypothetical protein
MPEFFDGFGFSVKVIVTNFADQNAVRVLLHQIDLSVKVPIAFNLDQLTVFKGFDNIGSPVTVRIDGNLVVMIVGAV